MNRRPVFLLATVLPLFWLISGCGGSSGAGTKDAAHHLVDGKNPPLVDGLHPIDGARLDAKGIDAAHPEASPEASLIDSAQPAEAQSIDGAASDRASLLEAGHEPV